LGRRRGHEASLYLGRSVGQREGFLLGQTCRSIRPTTSSVELRKNEMVRMNQVLERRRIDNEESWMLAHPLRPKSLPRSHCTATAPLSKWSYTGAPNPSALFTLLDTRYSIALISEKLIRKINVPVIQHESPIALYNLTGDLVPGAGPRHTKPVLLQH
jgi:hypothetical protein